MTVLLWLVVWLCQGAPAVQRWNAWAVSLIVLLALELIYFRWEA